MGGGGGPSSTTAYQTNLPEYAQPYVMNMLGAAQNQLFQTSGDQITGFKPYTPYSTNPQDYVAGPSNLQRSTYGEASNMQTPGGFGAAQGMAGYAGLGQLGAGSEYNRMATTPGDVARYMSPYMQNAVDVEKAAAVRDYQMAAPTFDAQATRQGAFGGNRAALQQAEAQRALGSRLGEIQARGTQAAYDKGIQSMQFGANLGLQGLQGAGQSAATMGQLAGAQQQADLARMGFQNQLGQQQQQYQQGIINQAIQDYATQQQYPLMQLGTMSSLLRGLPMQNQTTQIYQAQPSGMQQMLGYGLGALGAYKAFS